MSEPERVVWTVFDPIVIIDGVDPATGDLVVKVNAPGTTSETRLK